MNQAFLMSDNGLSRYLEKVRNFPMLSEAEEGELSRRWRDQGDEEALRRLAGSHLRLVVKMAMGNRGYGLPVSELISEGNLGLMQAIEKFDPERGFRLSTYARWWILAR
jgi:RNA polymerase sigma-32 factor